VPKDGKKDRHDIRERHFPSQTSWILVANSPRLRQSLILEMPNPKRLFKSEMNGKRFPGKKIPVFIQ
jgi:hypothetical protein